MNKKEIERFCAEYKKRRKIIREKVVVDLSDISEMSYKNHPQLFRKEGRASVGAR